MRMSVALILCLISLETFGQEKGPICFLDSVEINPNQVFVNSSNIIAVTTGKKTERGELYLKTKKDVHFLTLDMILKRYSNLMDDKHRIVYIINGKVVTEKSKVKIDSSFNVRLEIIQLGQLDYVDSLCKSMLLAEIELTNDNIMRIHDDGPGAKKK